MIKHRGERCVQGPRFQTNTFHSTQPAAKPILLAIAAAILACLLLGAAGPAAADGSISQGVEYPLFKVQNGMLYAPAANEGDPDPALDIEDLASQVRGYMRKTLGIEIAHGVTIQVKNSVKLRRSAPEDNLSGPRTEVVGKFTHSGDEFEIQVKRGVSKHEAVRILAHEFGHAFYEENCRVMKDTLHREGFSEWLCYRTIQSLGYGREMSEMEARTDLYGKGLKLMLEKEKEGGIQAVLEEAMY